MYDSMPPSSKKDLDNKRHITLLIKYMYLYSYLIIGIYTARISFK